MARLHRPKLGQHFLADSGYRARIAESLALRPEDLVIEIGAGHGAMTELLARRARRVIAVELDPALAETLKERFLGHSRIEVLEADILSLDLGEVCRNHECEKCFVFGNLPYYITSPILDRLRLFRSWVRAMSLLLQREVALRLIAAPGRRAYGYLSVMIQTFWKPRLAFNIPPGAFSPPPKVYSSLLNFEVRPSPAVATTELSTPRGFAGSVEVTTPERVQPPPTIEDPEKFLSFVKVCFAHKRRNLANNLTAQVPRRRAQEEIARLGLPPTVRAEQLTLDHFMSLYRWFACT